MIAIDTNVLLRYLLAPTDRKNPQWQTEQATQLIQSAKHVYLSDIVLAETEWVLETVFELKRSEIHQLLHLLACNKQFLFDDWPALQCALMDYRETRKVDFSDCLIARRSASQGAETLYTFENTKKLGGLPVATTLK